MIDINELRRMAQAATPGPWIGAGPSFGESLPKYLNEVAADREGDEDDGYSVCNAPIGLEEQYSDDMAFIGAANPAAVIELLDRLEAAEKERDALRAELAQLHKEADKFGDGVDWIQRALQAEAQIEQMEQQEPVATIHINSITGNPSVDFIPGHRYLHHNSSLYALPGAQGEEE